MLIQAQEQQKKKAHNSQKQNLNISVEDKV